MAAGLPSKYDVIARSLRRSRFITGIRDHSVSQRHLFCSHTKHSFVSMLQGIDRSEIQARKRKTVQRNFHREF